MRVRCPSSQLFFQHAGLRIPVCPVGGGALISTNARISCAALSCASPLALETRVKWTATTIAAFLRWRRNGAHNVTSSCFQGSVEVNGVVHICRYSRDPFFSYPAYGKREAGNYLYVKSQPEQIPFWAEGILLAGCPAFTTTLRRSSAVAPCYPHLCLSQTPFDKHRPSLNILVASLVFSLPTHPTSRRFRLRSDFSPSPSRHALVC